MSHMHRGYTEEEETTEKTFVDSSPREVILRGLTVLGVSVVKS
jgi:hypothetical protein